MSIFGSMPINEAKIFMALWVVFFAAFGIFITCVILFYWKQLRLCCKTSPDELRKARIRSHVRTRLRRLQAEEEEDIGLCYLNIPRTRVVKFGEVIWISPVPSITQSLTVLYRDREGNQIREYYESTTTSPTSTPIISQNTDPKLLVDELQSVLVAEGGKVYRQKTSPMRETRSNQTFHALPFQASRLSSAKDGSGVDPPG